MRKKGDTRTAKRAAANYTTNTAVRRKRPTNIVERRKRSTNASST